MPKTTGGYVESVTENGEIVLRNLGTRSLLTAEEFSLRVRAKLESRHATYVTAGLSEMRVAELLSGKIVDRHTGSIPDVLFDLSGESAFCEVKTVSTGGNWLVLKGDQIREFQKIDRCFFAITEHNMNGIRERLSTPFGREDAFRRFELVKSAIVSSEFVNEFYEWLRFSEQTIVARGVTYKRCRFSHLRKFAEETGEPVESVPGTNLLLVGAASAVRGVLASRGAFSNPTWF